MAGAAAPGDLDPGPARADLASRFPAVHFVGAYTGVSLAELYASADLFVFPSQSETFGNVTLEAMASGLAVIAFAYAAAREHIQDGDNGRCIDCTDRRGFRNAVFELSQDLDQAKRLGRAARTTAEKLDWPHIFERYHTIINSCLEVTHD